MGGRLWFIGDGFEPIYVHPTKQKAREKLERLVKKDPDGADDYEIYSVDMDDLEDHPEEMDLADQNGWL
jgi:hypothetical protein